MQFLVVGFFRDKLVIFKVCEVDPLLKLKYNYIVCIWYTKEDFCSHNARHNLHDHVSLAVDAA